MLHLQKSCKVA